MSVPFLDLGPMHKPIKEEMKDVFSDVYDDNWFVLGRRLETFEQDYALYNKTKYCIGVSNGLDALTLSLKALGLKQGDEVIVPSNTYIASVIAITHAGATPILVEPREETYNINPGLVERAITNRTKAILPVHLYGQSCEMSELCNVASTHGLFVVEDNAQSHGATYDGRMTGSWGDLNGTSFYPGKNLGALGDGGAITTDNETLAERVRVYRNYGSSKKYYNDVIGYNNRLDELQAAFLTVKLNYLDEWTNQRKEVAKQYLDKLNGVGDLLLPWTHPRASHVYHLFVVRTKKRNELRNYLESKGIGTLIHYPLPPHLQKAYQSLGYKSGDFPIAEQMAENCLSLPLYPGLTDIQIDEVVTAVKTFYGD